MSMCKKFPAKHSTESYWILQTNPSKNKKQNGSVKFTILESISNTFIWLLELSRNVMRWEVLKKGLSNFLRLRPSWYTNINRPSPNVYLRNDRMIHNCGERWKQSEGTIAVEECNISLYKEWYTTACPRIAMDLLLSIYSYQHRLWALPS